MRYGSGHKEETRRKILDIAGARFRKEGIEAVGVASLMADCGLTHGGFYAHFKSKDALVSASLENAMCDTGDLIFSHAQAATRPIEGFIRAYLSPEHRNSVEAGCAFSAITSEISRQDGEARATVAGRLAPYLDRIGGLLPTTDPSSAQRQAAALFSLLMGSLQLARLAQDRTLSDSILESGITAALDLVSVFSGV